MEYLHSLRPVIVHRDLKSHNVLRAFDGSMKVCDFGLAKIRNVKAGTPAYMAPELISVKPFNKSVDVYSFGVLLNELYSVRVPFYMYVCEVFYIFYLKIPQYILILFKTSF